MSQLADSKVLAFLAGLISASFGAGVTFWSWQSSHPTRAEITQALGCVGSYGSTLDECKVAIDAKEARRAAMAVEEDLKALRRDLSRGFGRALATSVERRDAAGKRAYEQFQHDVHQGIPPEVAMQRVLEGDF